MPPETDLGQDFVEKLLSLPTREEQADLLRDGGMLHANGLDRLLDAAEQSLGSDPGKAQRLARLCAEVAGIAGAPVAVPRAAYVRVRAYNDNGEFEAALRMARFAYKRYISLGMNLEALRTNVGTMATLLDLGRYREALDAGQAVLNASEHDGKLRAESTTQELDLLVALVHQNRGVCYEHMGRYEEALEAYTVSEGIYRNLGMKERLGEILDNRGTIFSYLGRSTEALSSHEAAAAIFCEAGLTLSHAMSLSNLGETHLRLGNFMSGLGALERARPLLGSFDAHAVEYFLLRNTADAYLALNLYSEALASYREVDGLLRSVGMEHDRARALWGMGSALAAQSRSGEAKGVLAEAARLFSVAGNVPMLSGVMLEQAALQEAQGDPGAALATAHRALDLVAGDGRPVQRVYARLRLADLLLPDTVAAEPHLLAAQRAVEHLALPHLRYRLNERLGRLWRLRGVDEEAQMLLEEAVEEIERLRGTVTHDAMRASFLHDKTAAYDDLLLLHLARDDEEGTRRAFAVAERAKSRALVDLITGVVEKEPVRSADPDLERRIRSSQADLNAVYGELLEGSSYGDPPVALSDLRARAVGLEHEIGRLRLQAAAGGHGPEPFVAATAPDDVLDGLPSDTALLAYHAAGDEILAFVGMGGRMRVARHLGTVSEVERLLRRLNIQWERLRASRGFAGRHMAMLERSARRALAALYEELVAPLEPLLDRTASLSGRVGSVPKLAVVPHGSLHRVPFHALFDGERYLIERFEISYAPSATVYALCHDREPSTQDTAAVFGVDDPLIPAATAEARAVARHLPGAGVRVGEDATIEALRGETGSAVLHLACHGLFRSDNPMFSALKLHDGWLTAADAMSLDLPGALVTLSACESGRSEVMGGDELLGLTRAFLGAGAATIVVSLWLVQDETTADLMGDWYRRMRGGGGRTTALRAAQLELKKRHPHPYYWAPFVLIGRR